MISYRIGGHRRIARTSFFFTSLTLALLAVGFINCPNASAGLIIDSVKYDGYVRSGATTGVEAHFTATDFPPPNTNNPLPAVAPFPLAPLNPPNNLSMSYTTATELFLGDLWATGIITISNPSGNGNSFANTLDSNIALPVQLDMYVYSDTALPANKKLMISGVGIENFNVPPFPIAASQVISNNRGTQDDPIRIQLGMTAASVATRNGFVKLHIHWGTEDSIVPEPSTFGLVSMAFLAMLGCFRRQHSC